MLFVMNRAQVLYKAVSELLLGLTNVEEATLGAAMHVVTKGGDREVQEGERGIRDGPGEPEVEAKGVSKVDELFKLIMGAQGSADTAIDVAEEE
eukprot:g29977.t1